MNASIVTLGCKVNRYDSEQISGYLNAAGIEIAGKGCAADILVVNSCTVTAESDRKTRQTARRLRAENPGSVLVVTGCGPAAMTPDKAASAFDFADVILTGKSNHLIAQAVTEFIQTHHRVILTNAKAPSMGMERGLCEHTRAYIKIQDGCDRHCSYCIIPTARGGLKSRPLHDIADEARFLAGRGFREVVLVGINLLCCGQGENYGMPEVLQTLEGITDIRRIRLGSIEPDLIDDRHIAAFKESTKLCPHFHISLQSGCDKTLTAMRRRYLTVHYMRLLQRLRTQIPKSAVTTDIMVGFPGETAEDFNESLSFAVSCGFSGAHVFAYSRRPETDADRMGEQVTKTEKARRAKIMSDTLKQQAKQYLQNMQGLEYEVLFETGDGNVYSGYTENYIRVKAISEADVTGEILRVRVLEPSGDGVTAEILL